MQPLSLLRLPHGAIARLEAHRIFSVNDLLRVARTASGRVALADLGLGIDLDRALDKAAILTLPTIPPALAEALVKAGVKDPDAFLAADPKRLAKDLSRILAQPISPDVFRSWQESTRAAFHILPSSTTTFDLQPKNGPKPQSNARRPGVLFPGVNPPSIAAPEPATKAQRRAT